MTRIAPLYLSDRTLFRSDRRMSILNGSILKSRIKEGVSDSLNNPYTSHILVRFVTGLTDNEASDHSDDELVELEGNKEDASEVNTNPAIGEILQYFPVDLHLARILTLERTERYLLDC